MSIPLLVPEPTGRQIEVQQTSFTLDTMGRFVCNSLREALDSTAQTVAGRRRDFDVIVIGGGTFGAVVAEHLFVTDRTRSRRILVLEVARAARRRAG